MQSATKMTQAQIQPVKLGTQGFEVLLTTLLALILIIDTINLILGFKIGIRMYGPYWSVQ